MRTAEANDPRGPFLFLFYSILFYFAFRILPEGGRNGKDVRHMSMIRVKNLTFGYEGNAENVFEDVSFQMDSDWRLGFIGRNGRGKTTFLRLLMGAYEYRGTISSDVEFEYFPYEVREPQDFTVDVIREIAPEAEDWEIYRELSLLRADDDILYRPYAGLSAGEKTKALLAALFLRKNAFLLIDEPTNHLDGEARRRLAEYLKRKKGFLLVSHDRAFLDACVDHILSVNRADIEIQKGNFSSWWENSQRRESFERAEQEKRKKEIGRLKEASLRTSQWSDRVEKSKKGSSNSGSKIDRGYVGHRSAKMMKRAKVLEERKQREIGEKELLLKNSERRDSLKLMPLQYRSQKLAELTDVSVAGCRPVRFSILQGERIAVRGKNGSGKSSLLKLVCGEELPHEGTVRVGGQLVISSVPQGTDELSGTLAQYAERRNVDETLLKSFLYKLGFSREMWGVDTEKMSMGQKKKVILAASLCERAHLYVWDEPLNYVDVISRIQIENLIQQFQPTLLFVEHDAAFCEKIATQTIEIG